MKKTILFILFLLQVSWIFTNGGIVNFGVHQQNHQQKQNSKELRGYSGILKVVYDGICENLSRVVTVDFMLPGLPKDTEQKTTSRAENTETSPIPMKNTPVICVYSIVNSFASTVKKFTTADSSEFDIIHQFVLKPSSLSIMGIAILLWMTTSMFLYLLKLKFLYFKPRSGIDSILFFSGLNKNPNWLCDIPELIRVFLFYESKLSCYKMHL